ncbi:MAG TPA: flagellin [Caulobacterales bacterium]|nr:flagellin [Caulobacterales bacterium]
MSGALTLRFTTQAQLDLRRMASELSDLQRQVASSQKANDLRGFGAGASRLLNVQSLRADADARSSAISQLVSRFGVQSSALEQVATGASTLANSIRDAVSSDDGRAIGVDLSLAFSSAVSGLNEKWNGQPLFAGDRTTGEGPIKISSLDQLVATTGPDDIFDEAAREQTFDLGSGPPISLASKASDMATPLFDTLKQLKQMLDTAGGELGSPLTGAQRDQLQTLAAQLDSEANTFTNQEGRAGQLEQRFGAESTRLTDRSNLLVKEISSQKDADLAMVSVQLSSLITQYQAAAKTFSDLSKLSLLDYL